MAYLKRQWKPLTIVTVLLVALAGAWLYRSSASGAAAVPAKPLFVQSYSPPTDVERSQVETLLENLSLDRDALVALNLSDEQAEDVLAAVRTFNTNTRETLDARLAALAATREDLWALQKALRNGTAGEDPQGQFTDAVADVAAARSVYNSTLDSLRTTIHSELSQSQQAAWTSIQSGWGPSMPLRMLTLDGEQRSDLAAAQARFEHALAEAEDDEERSAAVTAWDEALDGCLTQDQKTVCTSSIETYATASQHVTAAFETVLPEE